MRWPSPVLPRSLRCVAWGSPCNEIPNGRPLDASRSSIRLEADPRKGECCTASRTLPLAELLDQCRPQSPDFLGIIDSGLHQKQLRGWIDTNALAVGTDERELSPGSWKQPEEITITEIRHGVPWRKIDVGRTRSRRGDHVLRRNNLLAFPIAVVSEEAPEPRVVAEYSIEEAVRYLEPLRIDHPCGGCLCADRLP